MSKLLRLKRKEQHFMSTPPQYRDFSTFELVWDELDMRIRREYPKRVTFFCVEEYIGTSTI